MFFHVKYVYDWLKPIFASVVIIAGRVKASAKKIVSGNSARTSRDQPLPERHRLRVRVVDAEGADAVPAPVQDDVAQRLPQTAPVLRVEVDVVDVLVALGRVLGVLERPVRPPVEPLRMLPSSHGWSGEHWIAKSSAISSPCFRACRDEPVEVLQRAELGVDRVVAALRPADRPRAPGIALLGRERVVPPLAVRRPDRVDGRQVDHVEAELGELRQHLLDALEPAPGAREELVPRAEARALALDVDLERTRERRLAVPVLRAELGRGRVPLVDRAGAEQSLGLAQLAAQVALPGRELAVELVEQRRVAVDPGLDRELPAAERRRPRSVPPSDRCRPARAGARATCECPRGGSGRPREACRARP